MHQSKQLNSAQSSGSSVSLSAGIRNVLPHARGLFSALVRESVHDRDPINAIVSAAVLLDRDPEHAVELLEETARTQPMLLGQVFDPLFSWITHYTGFHKDLRSEVAELMAAEAPCTATFAARLVLNPLGAGDQLAELQDTIEDDQIIRVVEHALCLRPDILPVILRSAPAGLVKQLVAGTEMPLADHFALNDVHAVARAELLSLRSRSPQWDDRQQQHIVLREAISLLKHGDLGSLFAFDGRIIREIEAIAEKSFVSFPQLSKKFAKLLAEASSGLATENVPESVVHYFESARTYISLAPLLRSKFLKGEYEKPPQTAHHFIELLTVSEADDQIIYDAVAPTRREFLANGIAGALSEVRIKANAGAVRIVARFVSSGASRSDVAALCSDFVDFAYGHCSIEERRLIFGRANVELPRDGETISDTCAFLLWLISEEREDRVGEAKEILCSVPTLLPAIALSGFFRTTPVEQRIALVELLVKENVAEEFQVSAMELLTAVASDILESKFEELKPFISSAMSDSRKQTYTQVFESRAAVSDFVLRCAEMDIDFVRNVTGSDFADILSPHIIVAVAYKGLVIGAGMQEDRPLRISFSHARNSGGYVVHEGCSLLPTHKRAIETLCDMSNVILQTVQNIGNNLPFDIVTGWKNQITKLEQEFPDVPAFREFTAGYRKLFDGSKEFTEVHQDAYSKRILRPEDCEDTMPPAQQTHLENIFNLLNQISPDQPSIPREHPVPAPIKNRSLLARRIVTLCQVALQNLPSVRRSDADAYLELYLPPASRQTAEEPAENNDYDVTRAAFVASENEQTIADRERYLSGVPAETLLSRSSSSLNLGGIEKPDCVTLARVSSDSSYYGKTLLLSVQDRYDDETGRFLPTTARSLNRLLRSSVNNQTGDFESLQVEYLLPRHRGTIPSIANGYFNPIAPPTYADRHLADTSEGVPKTRHILDRRIMPADSIACSYLSPIVPPPLGRHSRSQLTARMPSALEHWTTPWSELSDFPGEAQSAVEEAIRIDSVAQAAEHLRTFVRRFYRYESALPESKKYDEFVRGIPYAEGTIRMRLRLVHEADDGSHLGAGVCAEHAIVLRELLAHANIPSALTHCIKIRGEKLSQNDLHLSPLCLLPSESGLVFPTLVDALWDKLIISSEPEQNDEREGTSERTTPTVVTTRAPAARLEPARDTFFHEVLRDIGVSIEQGSDTPSAFYRFVEKIAAQHAGRATDERNIFTAIEARVANAYSLLFDPAVAAKCIAAHDDEYFKSSENRALFAHVLEVAESNRASSS